MYIYIYISEVGGGSLAHPTGKSFRFVCACVRAVLVKSVRSENVPVNPCNLYFWPAGGRILYLVWFGVLWEFSMISWEFQWVTYEFEWVLNALLFLLFHWFLVNSSCVSLSSQWVLVPSNEFWWVQARSQWVPMSSQWVLVNSCKFYRVPVRSMES